VGGGEAVDPLGGGGESGAVSGLAGADGAAGRQVGLAGSRRSQENGVLLAHDEVQGSQVHGLLARQAAQMGDLEFLQGLDGGEAGGADTALGAVGFAGGDLTLQAGHRVLGVGPRLAPGPPGRAFGGVQQHRGLHRAGQEGQVGGGLLRGAAPRRSRLGGRPGCGLGVGALAGAGGDRGGAGHQSSSWPEPPWIRVNIRS
jgi:hypothetical protein